MENTKTILVFLSVIFIEFILVVSVLSLITPMTFMEALYEPMVKVGMLFIGWIIPIIITGEYAEQQ
jgi:hypothetical protein